MKYLEFAVITFFCAFFWYAMFTENIHAAGTLFYQQLWYTGAIVTTPACALVFLDII